MGEESLLSVLPGDMTNRLYRIEIRPYMAGQIRVQLLTAHGVLEREVLTDDVTLAMDVMNRCAESLDPDQAMRSFGGRANGRRIYLGMLA